MPSPDCSADMDLGEPAPELVEFARLHRGEDPDMRLQAIADLRDMIYERGECNPDRTDDEFLIKFLRARNFIPARAHRLLCNYYRFKEDNCNLMDNVYPLDLKDIGEANILSVPPYRGKDGRRLMIFKIGCWDPKVIPSEDIFKATILCMQLGIMEPRTQILGAVVLFDLEDIGTQHAWQITPSMANRIVKLLVSCFPVTTHAIHIINHAWIFDKIYNIFKPFLNSQMRSRIFFHGHDLSSLHKHIQPDYLPERYGGIWPDYSYTIWLESVTKNYHAMRKLIITGYKFREHEICPEVARQLKEEGLKLA